MMPWIRLFVAVLGWLPACQSVVRAGLWDVTTASGTTYPSTTLDSLSADSVWVSDAALRTSAVLIDEIVNLDAVSQPIIGGLYGTLIGAGVLAVKVLLAGAAPHRNGPLVDATATIGLLGGGASLGIAHEVLSSDHIDFRRLTPQERRGVLQERIVQ
jgi:hypothetical protein